MITLTTLRTAMREGISLATAAEREAVTPMAPLTLEDSSLDVLPLDSVHTYKRDIAPYHRAPSLPPEQRDAYEQTLVEQVREGCAKARERLITHLSPLVVRQAERYFYTYGWLHPMMDLGDLIQAGNIVLLEKLEHALSKRDPCSYLLSCTSAAIRYLRFTDTLIPTPRSRSVQPRFCSLDQPISVDDERPLLEVLAAPSSACSGDERDVSALYQAIDRLSAQQRQTILRRYGLCGMPEQAPHEIDEALYGGRPRSSSAEKRALCTLAGLLTSAYLDESEVILPRPACVAPDCQYRTLTDEERARLDTACAALLARGERITHDRLRKEAHIGSACAAAYLSQRGGGQPSPDRLERLRQAHATMAAQGVSMTISELSRVAHVDRALAHTYLRQLGVVSDRHAQHSKEAVQARLDQAYATLKAEQQEVQVSALMNAAHVTHQVAAPYLEERRAKDRLPPRTPPRRLPPRAQHDERQQLLADVYETLVGQGVPITLDRLCDASGLRIHEVRAFLAERGMTWEQQQERARTARLEAAFARLVEQQPQPPTIEQLAKAAQVRCEHASRFLAERGMTRKAWQAQERVARLEAAYAHLVEQSDEPLNITLLASLAQVRYDHASRFLKEQQSQAKGTTR